MLYPTILSISLFLASTTATPTPIALVPRSCQTQYPTSYQQIEQDAPSSSFPQGKHFEVSQSSGGINAVDTLVHFTGIPAGSYGCQLAVAFPANYPITSSGSKLLNVYAVPRDISPSDSYSTYFSKGNRGIPDNSYLFGSVTIDGSSHVINSKVCAPNLSFLFEIASDTQAGETEFEDNGSAANGPAGLYLTYNC